MGNFAEKLRARAAEHRGAVLGPVQRACTESAPARREAALDDAAQACTEAPTREKTSDFFGWSPFAPVSESADLRRVLDIPRRPPIRPDSMEAAALVDLYTARYARPGGTMRLKPVQAIALHEAILAQGLVGAIAVGGGKTLLSLLLPLAFGSRNALLLVGADLRAKLFDLEYPALSKHWYLPNLDGADVYYPDVECRLRVITYDAISRPRTADVLEAVNADCIILDEAHRVKNKSAARTKRFQRFVEPRPGLKAAVLSGTLTHKSIKDAAYLSRLALKERAPMPRDWAVLEHWAAALDPVPNPCPPGALVALAAPGEDVRAAFGRRLEETPGWVVSSKSDAACSLNIHARPLTIPPDALRIIEHVRATWSTPDGFTFDTALEEARYLRQVATGFWYRRTWPRGEPPELRKRWLEARNEWFSRVREYLEHHAAPGRDSPALLAEAAERGEWRAPEWAPWRDVRELAHPETEAVWFSDYMAEDAVRWGSERPGLVWVEHRALGERIAKLSGWPFYNGGDEGNAAVIREDGSRSIVVSSRANSEGKNLQHAFCRNLITTPSSSAKVWEQLLGRTHRDGQPADEVDVWVYAHTPESSDAVWDARENARFAQDVNRSEQKLLLATWTFEPQKLARR